MSSATAAGRRFHLHALAGVLCLTVAVYLPVFGFDFLNWDDEWYVLNNPLITGWDVSNLVRIFSEPSVKNYAPLTTLSLLVDHTLWGLQPGGYHGTNLLLHLVNACLVYLLLWRLTRSRFISWLTALLFAVHPVQVETVAWISSRKGLLSGTFILASLIFWLRPERNSREEGWGLLFLLLALLAKAVAVMVPAVVLTYDLLVRKKKFSEAFARQFLPGCMAFVFLMLTISSQTTLYGGVRSHMHLSKLHLLAVDAVILWRYAGLLFWPVNLCVLYDPPTHDILWPVAFAVTGWVAVLAVVYRLRRRCSLLPWALLSAFLFLLPVLNLVPITTLMNDRYLYLPCIPLFALLAAGLRMLPCSLARWSVSEWGQSAQSARSAQSAQHHLSERKAAGHRFGVLLQGVVVTAVLCGCTLATHCYLPVWRNSRALWEDASASVGHLPVVQYQLADAYFTAGERKKAVALLQRALQNETLDAGDRRRFRKTLAEWQRLMAAR